MYEFAQDAVRKEEELEDLKDKTKKICRELEDSNDKIYKLEGENGRFRKMIANS